MAYPRSSTTRKPSQSIRNPLQAWPDSGYAPVERTVQCQTDAHDDVLGVEANFLENLDSVPCARILDRVVPRHMDGVMILSTHRRPLFQLTPGLRNRVLVNKSHAADCGTPVRRTDRCSERTLIGVDVTALVGGAATSSWQWPPAPVGPTRRPVHSR